MKRAFLGIVSIVALVMLFTLGGLAGPGVVYAADGDLDPDFDADGRVTTDFAGHADVVTAVAVQPDGKIVASGYEYFSDMGDFTVARYYPDGTLDTGFSGDGKQRIDFNISDNGYAMALQPDGKIVLAGTTNANSNDIAMARLNPNGTLDTTFSFDGKVTTDFAGGEDGGGALAIQPDGKIVVAGMTATTGLGSGDYDFLVARYNSDGTLDTSFSGDGWVRTDFVGTQDQAHALAIQPDGKIVVGGHVILNGSSDFAVARYSPNGTLDNTFGFLGKAAADFSGDEDRADDIAIQADGRIVAAGRAATGNEDDFAVARFNTNGTLDTGFSGDGKVTTDFSAPDDYAHALAIYPDGKIVVAGQTGEVFALARYNANGTLDTGFSGDGKVTTAFQGTSYANAVAIQADGRIVAAGTNTDYALARYQSGGAVTPTPTLTSTSTSTSTAISSSTPTSTYTPEPTQTPGGPTATATPIACTIEFSDVPQGSTFYEFVRCMACRGIINGYTTGCETGSPCFRPNNNVTRGQLSKIVSNAAAFNEPAGAQQFEDVPTGSTFYDFVWRLADRGHVGGYACGGLGEPCGAGSLPYFRPNGNASRGQISKIVANAAGLSDPTGTQLFEDVLPSHTFYDYIQRLANLSVMGGYACGAVGEPCGPGSLPYFRPASNATRGQTSKIVANAFFPDCATPGKPANR